MSESCCPSPDEPTLSETDGIRYLHFGSEWVQGAMRIRKPDELVLDYTQQMMAWLLFVSPQADDRLAVLGLGAGSLLRYAFRHTPAHIDTVEWNPRVTAVCRAYFRLPESNRCPIIHADAGHWVQDAANHGRYAALMVDLYDAQAQGPVCNSLDFYQGCRRVLSDAGVMAVNLFGNHDSYPHNIRNIVRAFDARVLQLPLTPAGNRVILAFASEGLQHTTASLLERAEALRTEHRLPMLRWARALLDTRESRPAPYASASVASAEQDGDKP